MLEIFEDYGLEDKSISLVAVNPEKNEPITTINEFNLDPEEFNPFSINRSQFFIKFQYLFGI